MSESRSDSGATPVLSVVVVSISGAELLDECLEALISQPQSEQIEIHVISKEPRHTVLLEGKNHTKIHWQKVAAAKTIPAMRTLGIMESTAKLIALIEDDCRVGPEWLKSVLSAHHGDHIAIGGAIEPGEYSGGLSWGVFYCEYARFLAPYSGTVKALPGNNVSYKSSAIDAAQIEQGFYDVFVHEQWRKSGIDLVAVSGMIVRNNNSWQIEHCTSSPFHHGRAYAGQRFGDRFTFRRLLYGVLAASLPIVKSIRTLREIQSRKRTELPLFKALPWIIIFHSCWSVGEFIGYLMGPGQSNEKWR